MKLCQLETRAIECGAGRPTTDERASSPTQDQAVKRTDFVALCELTEQDVLNENSSRLVAETFAAGRPLMRFLCAALNVPF